MTKDEKNDLAFDKDVEKEAIKEFYDQVIVASKDAPLNSMEKRKPHHVARILLRLSQGIPIKQIHREMGTHIFVIRRIKRAFAPSLEEARKKMAVLYADVAADYLNLLRKKAENLDDDDELLAAQQPDKLAVTLGILTDHSSKLAGMNQIEIVHRKGPTIEDAQATIAAIRARIADEARNGAVEAQIISNES